jgi:hypothetical protein
MNAVAFFVITSLIYAIDRLLSQPCTAGILNTVISMSQCPSDLG